MNPFLTNNKAAKKQLGNKENKFDLHKEKKKEIHVQNKIKINKMKDKSSKEKNGSNSNSLISETKICLVEPINNEGTKRNIKTFLNRKRNHEKTHEAKKDKILSKDNTKEKKDINKKEKPIRGRRKKNVEYDNKPAHDKFKEDNIIKKIKTAVFDYILDHLVKSLKHEIIKFYPLSKELNSNIRKDFNEELLNRTIYDIYMKTDLNNRYINIPDSNRNLIKKIYAEKIETDTIKILEKKFKDILDYIREKDLDNFLNEFRKKEIKRDAKLIDKYMKDVKKMLYKYEFWFKVKLERNSRKN